MGKQIAIMQPTYMPWLGYFSMIDQSDEFVFLDNVQLVQRSWQVRNKIKLNGIEKMLTIPVNKDKSREYRYICNTRYSGCEWKDNHIRNIQQAYSKAKYYESVMPFIYELYMKEYSSIGEMNINFIKAICNKIGIETSLINATNLGVTGRKDALLVDICKKRGADTYLSAQGSAAYIEANGPAGEFGLNGISLYYLNYNHPRYRQLGEGFIPFIGVFDLLFNEGFSAALSIIRDGAIRNFSSAEYRAINQLESEKLCER